MRSLLLLQTNILSHEGALSDIKRVRKALFFFRFCLERWLWQSEIVLSNSLAPQFYYQVMPVSKSSARHPRILPG